MRSDLLSYIFADPAEPDPNKVDLLPASSAADLEQISSVLSAPGVRELAVFLAEAHRPLRRPLANLTSIAAPVVGAIFGRGRIAAISRILRDPVATQSLIQRLEDR